MTSLRLAYQSEMAKTRQAVAQHLERQWRALPDHRDEQVQPFLDRVLPVVKAGQTRAVSLTAAYVSAKMKLTSPLALPIDKLTGAAVRGGVEPSEVYTRPFVTVWSSIEKIGYAAAVAKGLSRLMSTAEMDVAMSARDATVSCAQASGGQIVGWTRVADPSCCDFCQTLDGVVCGPNEPQPLHNNCGCDADPIEVGSSAADTVPDTGGGLTVGDVTGDVSIELHGEMGPLITDSAYEFTAASDLPESYTL